MFASSVHGSFWELHKKLGECYQADLQHAQHASERVHSDPQGLPMIRQLSSATSKIKRQESSTSERSGDAVDRRPLGRIAEPPGPSGSFIPEPPLAPPKVLSGDRRLSLRSNHSEALMSQSGSNQRPYLSGDVEAEEKAMERVKSGSQGTKKYARFSEAREMQMQVPASRSSDSDDKEDYKEESSPNASPKIPRREKTDELDGFETRACWHLELATSSFLRRKSNITIASKSALSLASHESMQEIRDAVAEKMQQHKDMLVIHPHATFKIVWDLFGMMFLIRDIFFIPLQLFNAPETYFIEWMDTTSLIFWTVDIFISFFTGYYDKGRLELHHKRIACNYMKTWFPLDVVVVGIDWWFQTQQNTGAEGVARVTKSIRSARFLRMFRLIRLSKMNKVSIVLREQISSEAGIIYFGILVVILRIFVLQHIIACGWWGVGDFVEDTEGKSWIQTHSFRERTFNYQYATCLHWAFAQLGIGSVEIDPETTQERIFCIGVAFVGLISFSTLVSTVTSLMSNLQKAQDQEQQLFRDLRHFLHHNDIPIELSQRVTRFLQHAYRAQTSRSMEGEVAIFSLLSKSLKAELQFTRYRHCLFSLALCKKILVSDDKSEAETVAQSLAMKTLTTVQLAQNDFIFSRGTVARTCFCALEDNLEYVVDRMNRFSVSPGQPIAEMAVWTPWVYVGGLVAKEMSRVVAIDVEAFCSTVAEMSDIKEQAIYLAQNIIEAMNEEKETITDLWQFHVEDASELGRDTSEVVNPLSPLVRYWSRFRPFLGFRHESPVATMPSTPSVVPALPNAPSASSHPR